VTKIFDRFLKDPESISCGCDETCCGSQQPSTCDDGSTDRGANFPWMTGRTSTPAGDVLLVSGRLSFADRAGTWRVRLGLGRMTYTVPPGLYGISRPDATSPVFVTANFKMSFDRVRRALDGIDGWILVLDTRGINVWCAAGKGTFGTDELVRRIESSGLDKIVSHRRLILPQLGAPGVAAHEVTKHAKFHIVYGPNRAEDIPAFLRAGMKTTPAMRLARFGFKDRLILTPVELVTVFKHWAFLAVFALWIPGLFGLRLFSVDFPAILGSVIVGAVAVPVLLPWIPGRAFAWKGWLLGLVWTAAILAIHGLPVSPSGWAGSLSYVLILPALSAFLAMNFTGSSPITSLSGVVKEMRKAVPLILVSSVLGAAALIVSTLVKG
jgi:hypothetical protein